MPKFTDDTLACTFEAMACTDCRSEGRTATECADTIHPEQVLRAIQTAGLALEQAHEPAVA